MTFSELKKLSGDVHDKIRHFRTFIMLLNASTRNISSISAREKELPELDDIAAVAFILAVEAEISVERLCGNLPPASKGITP